MGIPVLVIGESGSGKSTSMRFLKKAGIINVYGKALPFKSDLKTVALDNAEKIIEKLQKAESDILVIDDFQGLLVTQFMNRVMEKSYDKFSEMAKSYYDIIRAAQALPSNKRIYFMSHIERDQYGHEKIKTLGKLLDEKITVEGLFTIVIKSVVLESKYYFATHNSGNDTVKSPMGMFKEDLIPNDLVLVDQTICNYYGINKENK